MYDYDVFNGDADGICALQQLRLCEPRAARLITGPKREIALLARVPPHEARRVTVLDLSLAKNAEPLQALLAAGAEVIYFDHHDPGEVPQHPRLSVHLDQRPETCTSLIVDEYLQGQARAWAVVGAFGDNLETSARCAAAPLGLADADLKRLRRLGIYLNYNGYGERVEDLHIRPAELSLRLRPYADPLVFIAEDSAFAQLEAGYREDMARARSVRPAYRDDRCCLLILPNEPWARRASGTLANELAQAEPDVAHAILTCLEGGYIVSVRAPLTRPYGAGEICRRFPTGGGRAAAGGINHLPGSDYDAFLSAFRGAFL
ncbi:acetyltransferase [Caldichromatium japonicum]|uniref:Acetyltransferase n=1 Tax=Caldichromatium japonicum TaxID=2699430 RepID=A0A6G7VCD3_9GAMM|nr:acetyltransferase [Caldichromatium japonicum]QIK37536.1 acetyltransferase [Caldichromatium japonicum]